VNQEVVKHGWTVLAAEHYCFTCTLERKKVKAKKLEDKARVHAVVLVQALEAILPLAETLVSRYAEEFDSYKTRMARILLESLIPEKEVQ
jgi:PHP family Zn ribbon phosphoesterase